MIEFAPIPKFTKKIWELLNSPEGKSLVKPINDDYLYWDKVKYKKSNLPPHELWQLVKMSRQLNVTTVSFGSYAFNYMPTDYISKMGHHFDMNIGGNMAAKSVIPEEDKTRYLVSSIMEEAISSSQIEGANTTRKKAKEMLRKEVKPHTISEQMIMNNYHTIKNITQNKDDDLTPSKLLQLHKLMTNKTLENCEEEGCFRIDNEVVVMNHSTSEVVHTPPDFNELDVLIEDLCRFFNTDDENFIHPLVKGIIIHFMIGWIHPFSDGNGRTARALFYWYLLKNGYWLTE